MLQMQSALLVGKSGQGTTPRKWKPWQNYHAEIRDTSRYLKKKYNQLEVDCEVCGCKVKKNKWARHVGIWWGERVGRTEHHALPLLLWLYTRLDFYGATTVTNAGGLRSCFQKFSESFEADWGQSATCFLQVLVALSLVSTEQDGVSPYGGKWKLLQVWRESLP